MAVRDNTITKANTVAALDQDMVENFTHEFDRFAEIIGLFSVETVAAGTALYQYTVTGSLDNTSSGDDGTSGTGYVEGDFVKRSKYTVTKDAIGEVTFIPYAKQTTAQAILKGGFENAVARTDRKALQEMRSAILTDFFTALNASGITTTSPASGADDWSLQQTLAYTAATLGDVMETAGDEGDAVYFVNRQDAAAYLGKANITTQDTFGMTYLADFLGVKNVLLTNKVASGSVFATPVENIHVYGIDFGTLGASGLDYETDAMGLIGVHHEAEYNFASADTHLVRAATFLPEIKTFIVKGGMSHIA